MDTGGTFTDLVGTAHGRLFVLKLPSTPDDPARAVIAGVTQLLALMHDPATHGAEAPYVLVHGSTVATNALLERRGARVAVITNAGFEDIIEIGRQNRPQLYALCGQRPQPLVAAADRIGIAGRLDHDGHELVPLDPAELAALPQRLAGVEAAAICLLHSYANPAHEQAVAASLAPAGCAVSVSSALLPEHREYERTATTVVNAYVGPLMDRYLGRLEETGGAAHLRVMGSAGGALPVRRARAEPVHTVLSGPAGGVMGALDVARRHGFTDLITFDMGGTSTDVSLAPGRPQLTREFSIAGLPVAVPVLDIHTIGAGGGSIAQLDVGGALRVGPASAGAEPGPICYGRGGTNVTVTDANVWLGRLPVAAWPHGDVTSTRVDLDRAAIERPLAALAERLGLSTDDAAAGILAVAETAMEGALRVISVERGHDPAACVLVPFGGAAGLHAVELAARLGVARVLVPPAPGVLSAYGMLAAPVSRQTSRTVMARARADGDIDIAELVAPLVDAAVAAMQLDGFAAATLALAQTVDARYRGQSFELTVPATAWVEAFHRMHHARYGHDRRGEEVELVVLRVVASAAAAPLPVPQLTTASAPPRPVAELDAWQRGARLRVPHYERASLHGGHVLRGPAVLSEYSATLWLPPGWSARTLADGALLLAAGEA